MSDLLDPVLVCPELTGPRFLVGFVPRKLPILRWPVLVVGGGAAGGSAALSAAAAGVETLVLEKGPSRQSNTWWAQGGVAAAIAELDSARLHAEDTVVVGCGLSDEGVVDYITTHGPGAIERLERLGLVFDQKNEQNGKARELSREGGHSVSRVLSAGGDSTGRAIQECLDAAMADQSRITVRRDLRAIDVLVAGGRCIGVLAMHETGELVAILAGSTVLATGAVGQLFRETTNPTFATGDGLAMAFRAGVRLRDLEFVQFHPTTLYIAGASRVLVSEAVRGAGASLVDRSGRPVMDGVHEQGDLAPRDVVSRAILARMVETGDTHVYLDASRVPDVEKRFPQIARMCSAFDIEIDRDPIPVRPGAHYMVGGITTDLDARSSMPGLFACGEVAATGLHGANRLASNSLLEAIVMGHRAGEIAAIEAERPSTSCFEQIGDDPAVTADSDASPENAPRIHLDDMLYSLKSLMWRQVGLVRSAEALTDATVNIRFWQRVLAKRRHVDPAYIDLSNMLLVGRLVAASALAREESRGTHFRSDHPEPLESWRRHVVALRPEDETR
ncbi:MAG: L-aspartate oxidase [Planctomycetes bacterium]|nr:L-aspartate oxidase [Planctomycetota bacterium]MCB9917266.1 L-aspartate oxidase [Planctomycetota bacterium]